MIYIIKVDIHIILKTFLIIFLKLIADTGGPNDGFLLNTCIGVRKQNTSFFKKTAKVAQITYISPINMFQYCSKYLNWFQEVLNESCCIKRKYFKIS